MVHSLVRSTGRVAPSALVLAVAQTARGIAEELRYQYHSESALIPLLLVLLVLLGAVFVVIFLVRVLTRIVRQLRHGFAEPPSAQVAPEPGVPFQASATADRGPASRRIAAIDPNSIGGPASPAAAVVVGMLLALIGIGVLAVGVSLWRLSGPSVVAAWFVAFASLFIVAATYRPLRQVLGARRRRGFAFVMDQTPGHIGGAVGGTIVFPAGRQPAGQVEATLACLSVRRHLRGRRPDILTLWSQSRTIQTIGVSERLSASFDVPPELPSSDPSPGFVRTAIVWCLIVKDAVAGGPGNIAFVLPILA
jgi:hypothetical protein